MWGRGEPKWPELSCWFVISSFCFLIPLSTVHFAPGLMYKVPDGVVNVVFKLGWKGARLLGSTAAGACRGKRPLCGNQHVHCRGTPGTAARWSVTEDLCHIWGRLWFFFVDHLPGEASWRLSGGFAPSFSPGMVNNLQQVSLRCFIRESEGPLQTFN